MVFGKTAHTAPGRKAFQTLCGVVGKASHEAVRQKEAKGGVSAVLHLALALQQISCTQLVPGPSLRRKLSIQKAIPLLFLPQPIELL